jgi:hypothetical protein
MSLDVTSTELTSAAIVSQELKKADILVSCIQGSLAIVITKRKAAKLFHRLNLFVKPPSMGRKSVGCQAVILMSASQDLTLRPFRALMDTVHALTLLTQIRQFAL